MALFADNLNLDQIDTMEIALKSNVGLEALINETARNYHTIDATTTMTKLNNVGKLLKLAYAGSIEFKFSNSTIEILLRYQSTIKNFSFASASLVRACLLALKNHRFAIEMIEKDQSDASMKMLESCASLSEQMELHAQKLKYETAELVSLCKNAIIACQADNWEREEANGSLFWALKALSQVKTKFEHTRMYWLGVKGHCSQLANIETLQVLNSDAALKEMFIQEIKSNCLSWLTLGKINYLAMNAIQDVDEEIDAIMSKLPSKLEAIEIIKYEADKILNSLEAESAYF